MEWLEQRRRRIDGIRIRYPQVVDKYELCQLCSGVRRIDTEFLEREVRNLVQPRQTRRKGRRVPNHFARIRICQQCRKAARREAAERRRSDDVYYRQLAEQRALNTHRHEYETVDDRLYGATGRSNLDWGDSIGVYCKADLDGLA